jgi:N-methylhydantoinase B/oxoprolinase/acetone carboxylase alpha subunit
VELAEAKGPDTLLAAFDAIVERTRARVTRAAAKLPAGDYRFTDVMDDDGKGAFDMPISVQVSVGRPDGRVIFDFAGTSPAVRGNINCPYYATQSSVAYVFRSMVDPECPINQGMLDAMEVIAPEGCMVNAAFPSAVAGRANTCQRIIDTVIGALAPPCRKWRWRRPMAPTPWRCFPGGAGMASAMSISKPWAAALAGAQQKMARTGCRFTSSTPPTCRSKPSKPNIR